MRQAVRNQNIWQTGRNCSHVVSGWWQHSDNLVHILIVILILLSSRCWAGSSNVYIWELVKLWLRLWLGLSLSWAWNIQVVEPILVVVIIDNSDWSSRSGCTSCCWFSNPQWNWFIIRISLCLCTNNGSDDLLEFIGRQSAIIYFRQIDLNRGPLSLTLSRILNRGWLRRSWRR